MQSYKFPPHAQQPHPAHPSARLPLALDIPRTAASGALPSPASQSPSPRTARHDTMLSESSSGTGSSSATSPEVERHRKGSLFIFSRDDSSRSWRTPDDREDREMTKKERKAQKALEAAAASGHSPLSVSTGTSSRSLGPLMGWLVGRRPKAPEEHPLVASGSDSGVGAGARRRAGSLGTVSSNGSSGREGSSVGGRGGKLPRRQPALAIGGGIDDMFLRSIADSSYLKKPPRAVTAAVVAAAAVAPRTSSVKSGSTISRRHSYASLSPSVRPGSSASRPTGMPPAAFVGDGRLRYGGDRAAELPAVPSTLLLDLFTRLLVTFSNTSKLFTYAKHSTMKMRGSFSHSRSVIDYDADESEDEDEGAVLFPVDDDADGESNVLVREVLEKRAWFLSAMKWLSFERVLFSPGHHLMMMSPGGAILDLDGGGIADRSWHLSLAYPTATIYTLLLPSSSSSSPAPSPPPPPNSHPPNLHFIRVPSLQTLSTIPACSIDVITSHYLPRFLLHPTSSSAALPTHILRECHRILKPAGYLELTLVDPHLSNMGVLTRAHIDMHVPFAKPATKTFNRALNALGPNGEGLFDEVKTCDVWMPTTSIGDELSTVTSRVGRCFYDQMYAGHGYGGGARSVAPGLTELREGAIWKDAEVIEECARENTAFRWTKCYARKF